MLKNGDDITINLHDDNLVFVYGYTGAVVFTNRENKVTIHRYT